MAIGGTYGLWYLARGGERFDAGPAGILAFVFLGFLLFGVFSAISTVRTRVTLIADMIEVQHGLRSRSLLRSNIAGRRLIRSQNVSTLTLVPRDPAEKNLKIPLILNTDQFFHDWLADLPDLDASDRAESEKELEEDPDLGFKSEDRARQVVRAKRAVIFLNVLAAAGFFGVIFVRQFTTLFVVLLAMLPLVVILLMITSRGIYQVEGRRNDARPNLGYAYLFPGFGLAMCALRDSDALRWAPLLVGGAIVALLMTAACAAGDRGLRQRLGALLPLLLVSLAYGFGLVAEANVLPDRSSPQVFQVRVLGKHISRGKSTTYYLHLDSWGPQLERTQVSVAGEFYNSTAEGQFVCAAVHPGVLRVPWYRVGPCN